MNKIAIVYSIMHTGTWFTCLMIEKTNLKCLSRSDSWLSEGYNKTIENIKCDVQCSYKFWSSRVRPLRQDGWKLGDVDLLILQAHHDNMSNLYQTILKRKPEIPIVIPMRDPLLSLHSKNWRAEEYHYNEVTPKQRTKRCNKWIQLYKNILNLPKNNVFILPIDIEQTKEEKIDTIKRMANHIGIEFTEEMEEAAIRWGIVNDTEKLIRNTREREPAPKWENFKERYKERDIEHTKHFMDIEFDILRNDKELQRMLYNIGYRDLLWWRIGE